MGRTRTIEKKSNPVNGTSSIFANRTGSGSESALLSRSMLRGISDAFPLAIPTDKLKDLDAWLSDPGLARRAGEARGEYHSRLLAGADDFDGTTLVALLDVAGLGALATLLRIRLGLDLLPEQPDKRRGRGKWQKETARRLGMKARNLRNYLAAAEAIEEARLLATPLPVAVLTRRLDKIPAVIKRLLKPATWMRLRSRVRPRRPRRSGRGYSASGTR